MKKIVALSIALVGASVFAGTATERYADAAAATAQTNAQIYADAKITAATNGIPGKIAATTNGIPEAIHAVDVTANAARDAATNAVKIAQAAVVTANAASNVAATASLSLAAEIVTRQNADATHTANIAAETAARENADTLLANQISGAISAVSNKAESAALAAETAAREAADAIHGAAINGKQATLVSGTNIKTINNQSLLGSGNITIEGGGGSGTSNYEYLNNKPRIGGIEIVGNHPISYYGGTDNNAVNALIRSYDSTNITARIDSKRDKTDLSVYGMVWDFSPFEAVNSGFTYSITSEGGTNYVKARSKTASLFFNVCTLMESYSSIYGYGYAVDTILNTEYSSCAEVQIFKSAVGPTSDTLVKMSEARAMTNAVETAAKAYADDNFVKLTEIPEAEGEKGYDCDTFILYNGEYFGGGDANFVGIKTGLYPSFECAVLTDSSFINAKLSIDDGFKFSYTDNPNNSLLSLLTPDNSPVATSNMVNRIVPKFISSTDPSFSNAVLAVGLNIDTNSVAVLNEIAASFGGFPIAGTATTVGGLLAALAAAIAWLRKRKIDKITCAGVADITTENGTANVSTLFSGANTSLTSTIGSTIAARCQSLDPVNSSISDVIKALKGIN